MKMQDWQAESPHKGLDLRPWDVKIKTDVSRIDIEATCPDKTKREIWIEISDGKLVVHGYDPEHDEPVNMRIGKSIITIDSDRDEYPVDKIIEFAEQMARMSLPEEKCGDQDVDEYISDLDEERLYGEYHAFMDMVRAARELVK